MIDIQDITYGYGAKCVLKNINITIKPNSLTALIGLNGAGKSTLLNCLAKQKNVQSGRIVVCGKNIEDYSFRSYSKFVSVVPQLSSIRLIDCRVRDFLVEGRTPYLPAFSVPGKAEYLFSENMATKMGIEKILDVNFLKLSGGEQQLVLLTRALVQDTPIILLDEPLSALDLKNQAFFLNVLKQLSENGKTVIFSTHNPNHALLLGCDVLMMKNGEIVCHNISEKCLTQENLQNVYGDSVRLTDSNYGPLTMLNL